MTFFDFLINVYKLRMLNSQFYLKEELEYYYPNLSLEKLSEEYEKYEEYNRDLLKLYKTSESGIDNKMPILVNAENFYSKAYYFDIVSAYEQATYVLLDKEKISEFQELLLNLSYRKFSDPVYKHLRSKTITFFLKSNVLLKQVRDYINVMIFIIGTRLVLSGHLLIKVLFDGLIFEYDKKIKESFFEEWPLEFRLSMLKNLIFFDSNKYVYLSDNKFVFKGFPYTEFNYVLKAIEFILTDENVHINSFYDKDFMKKFSMYDFVIKENKAGNNTSVHTKEGIKEISDTSLDEIDYDFYIDYFDKNYGKFLLQLENLIH